MGETTFLLGAGFSKPFGGPLVSDLSTVLTDPPSKAIDPLKFELTDLISMVNNYKYNITSNDKLRYNTNSVIDFFIRYKSFLISEYLTEYYCLPSYETVIGQMSKDTLLFESSVKKDYTNPLRKNKIIEIGNFIQSEVGENERFFNLILNCIDYLTLLVFDKIQENISINSVEEPLILEFLKETDTKTNILTLNYDNVLEELLLTNEISFSDGFEKKEWDIFSNPIFKFNASSFDQSQVNLFKMHGSINYGVVGEDTINNFIDTTTIKYLDNDEKEVKNQIKQEKGFNFYPREFIIGSYNKSEKYFRRTFIELFNIGISNLNKSNTLIVIGYSFQDVPINLIISNWLKQSNSNKMIVINGEFKGSDIPVKSGSAIFRSHLNEQVANTGKYLQDMNLKELNRLITNK